jgi:hypothetical protein
MLLYYGRFFTSDQGIQVAFTHLSDLYPTESLKQFASQVSEQYRLLEGQLSEQEEVMIITAPDLTAAEIVFLTSQLAAEVDPNRTDIVLARVTNLQALCRLGKS